jgi:SAM-dependent methyltransferase
VEPDYRPGPDEERARYETHENDPADAGYRAFLDRLALPLAERLSPGAEGLDYGSGPGPTLSVMLGERGFRTQTYDPFFAPSREPLRRRYDFVTCSETVEHFFDPGQEFETLDRLLRPGGWLAVMTAVFTDDLDFGSWWYVRDPTHVAFYAPETLEWIATHFRWTLDRPTTNVALFRQAGPGTPPIGGV